VRFCAVVLGGGVVDEAALSIDLQDGQNLVLARSQSNLLATTDGEEVNVVPAALIGKVKVVLSAGIGCGHMAKVLDGEQVLEPSIGSVAFADDRRRLCLNVDRDNLLLILDTVVGAVDNLAVLLGEPRNFADYEIILGERINGDFLNGASLNIKQVEANSGVLGSHLGVTQLQFTSVDRCDSGVVHVVGNTECADASLVEAEVGNELAVGAVPHGIAVSKDLLLVHPVGDSYHRYQPGSLYHVTEHTVEEVRATSLGDLLDGAIVPEVKVVTLDESNLGRRDRAPCSILDGAIGLRVQRDGLSSLDVLHEVVGVVAVPVLFGVVYSPQDMARVRGDEVVPVVSRDLVCRQESRRLAGRDVLKEERAIVAGEDVVAVFAVAHPAEGAGGGGQAPRSVGGDVVRQALGAIAERLMGEPRGLNCLDQRQGRGEKRKGTHRDEQQLVFSDQRERSKAREGMQQAQSLCSNGSAWRPKSCAICSCRIE
jgi:hypothetical protein